MTEEERQSIIDEIKEQLLADMVDITKLPKGDATDGASLPVLQHSELVIQELNNFIGVYDIDVERQSADSDIVNIYLKNAAGVVIKTIVTNAATLEQVNTKVAKINESLTLISSSLSAKQDKLVSGTNIKTINGTSLLGSGDVSIEGGDSTGDVDEGRLVWSKEAVSQGTIIDGIMYNAHQNGLAFMNPSCIDVYYSIDNGDTWQDYGLTTTQKVYLVTPVTGNYNLYLGKDSTNKSVNYRLRVDLRIKDAGIQFTGKKLYLKWLRNTSSDAYYIDISVLKYENYESNEWTHVGTFHKKNTLTIPLNEVMGYNGARGILSLRIEAYRTGTTEPRYNSALTNIAFLYTAYSKGNSFGKTGLPMTIDTSQTAIFPAYIKGKKLITDRGKSTQVVLGDGSLRPISELSPITDADAEILLDNHIHSIDVKASGNNVNISVIESSKSGNNWETEDNNIPIPLATPTSAGVMSKEDKSKLDGLTKIWSPSGMPSLIGDLDGYSLDISDLGLKHGGLYLLEAEEENEIDGYTQAALLFVYRTSRSIVVSVVSDGYLELEMGGNVIDFSGTGGTGTFTLREIHTTNLNI